MKHDRVRGEAEAVAEGGRRDFAFLEALNNDSDADEERGEMEVGGEGGEKKWLRMENEAQRHLLPSPFSSISSIIFKRRRRKSVGIAEVEEEINFLET